MHHRLKLLLVLASGLVAFFSSFDQLPSFSEDYENLLVRLETVLNAQAKSKLIGLREENFSSKLKRDFAIFSAKFPNAKWTVRGHTRLKDGRQSVEIVVSGRRKYDGQIYSLEGKQIIAFRTELNRIINQEIITEQAILRSNNNIDLPVKISIPDAVLTGSKYDIDVIFEEPIGNAIAAGGLISLSAQEVKDKRSPEIELEPLSGGGLFKSVQAPLDPGEQTWAAMLAHPSGIITITKRVRIVERKEDLTP